MKTIVPTSCIVVAGQEFRQWRKLYRNKINMFGLRWAEHVYEFYNRSESAPREVRIYTNSSGSVVWATGNTFETGINSERVISSHHSDQTTTWLGWKKEWKRSFSDVRFLLSFERTREDFINKVTEHRVTWLLYPSKEVEGAVSGAYYEAELGQGRPTIGTYSGPASLTIQELRSLGVRICHKPPTSKFPELAPGDHVVENFNWGAEKPQQFQWFRYGAGYHYHGTKGCNSGWVWYE